MPQRFRADHLYTTSGWMTPGYFEIDEEGRFSVVAPEPPPEAGFEGITSVRGFVVPGAINLHSHAHHRALAGRTERASEGQDDNLWTWRTQMYACAERIEPEDLEALAAQAYVEMLEAGYTTVAEFHYLHHDRSGRPYEDPAEMSTRILAAAGNVEIGITLLPVLYTSGGVGKPPLPEQRRFVHSDPDVYLSLVERLSQGAGDRSLMRLGMAVHSLRAVDEPNLRYVVDQAADLHPRSPIHIHVAERREEIEECLAGLGAAPIDWLIREVGIDKRWTLVHATHASRTERMAVAALGAVVGLCPETEADLGDGVFRLVAYVSDGGTWGIGTDTNQAVSVVQELRTLEHGQRLKHERQNILTDPSSEATAHAGRRLLDLTWAGGARSVDQAVGAIQVGKRADLVVLDPDHPSLIGHGTATVLDAWIFSSASSPIRDVMVAGRWVVRDGRHERREEVLRRFRRTIDRLWNEAR
jgi:formimidoylglutamate deiminase